MTGFQAPNYTQVPNDFFEMAREMDKAEVKVVLAVIRETFGYHRDSCEMSIRQLARAAGLTPRNAFIGAEKAIDRGLIEKTVSSTNTTKWKAVVAEDTPLLSQRIRTVSPRKAQPKVKESKETKIKYEDEELDQLVKNVAMRELSNVYSSEIGVITPMIADELREAINNYNSRWIRDAIHEAAIQNKRGWKYVLAILERWKAQGNQEAIKPQGFKKPAVASEPRGFDAIRQWASKQEDLVNGN